MKPDPKYSGNSANLLRVIASAGIEIGSEAETHDNLARGSCSGREAKLRANRRCMWPRGSRRRESDRSAVMALRM